MQLGSARHPPTPRPQVKVGVKGNSPQSPATGEDGAIGISPQSLATDDSAASRRALGGWGGVLEMFAPALRKHTRCFRSLVGKAMGKVRSFGEMGGIFSFHKSLRASMTR